MSYTQTITLQGGPLAGKTYHVPGHATQIQHDSASRGTYIIKGNKARWQPKKPPTATPRTAAKTAQTKGSRGV